jgi:hypothetical protein
MHSHRVGGVTPEKGRNGETENGRTGEGGKWERGKKAKRAKAERGTRKVTGFVGL